MQKKNSTSNKIPSELFKIHKQLYCRSCHWGIEMELSLLCFVSIILCVGACNYNINSPRSTSTHTEWLVLPGCLKKIQTNAELRNEEYKLCCYRERLCQRTI